MIKRYSNPDAVAIRQQVLRGIAGNRTPGLHFPGFFLDTRWQEAAGKAACVSIPDGAHCRDTNGEMDVVAIAVLADTALATATRLLIEPGARLATIHMQIQFTGAPATGEVSADARLLGFGTGGALHQSLTSATLTANGKPLCYASGEFVLLQPPPGVTLAPLPWQQEMPPADAPLDESKLDARERTILEACDAALARSSSHVSFIQQFWGGVPKRAANGTTMRVALGPHLGNRVGHLQGGISFGMAAACACAAVPETMMLSNVSAWYIGPGHGKAVAVKSSVVHAGRSIAVVRTEIKTAAGERVLEAVTHHVARKRE
jgi:acyl-coenzyme A thioesterase PaaI-like protein